MRELRADFRAVYHCSYDEVTIEEAIDLIGELPDGSRYLAAIDPRRAWTLSERRLADIQDRIAALTQMLSDKGTTEGAPKVSRPWDELVRRTAEMAERIRMATVKDRMEKTKWVDVEVEDGEHRQG